MLVSTPIERDARAPKNGSADFGLPERNGSVLGVRFGDRIEDVKKQYAKARSENDGLVVLNPTDKYRQMSFSFTPDGLLCQIRLEYTDVFLATAGDDSANEGIRTLVANIALTRGPCNRMSNKGTGTPDDPKAYVCDWDRKGRSCGLTLTIVQGQTPRAVLSIEPPAVKPDADADRRWF